MTGNGTLRTVAMAAIVVLSIAAVAAVVALAVQSRNYEAAAPFITVIVGLLAPTLVGLLNYVMLQQTQGTMQAVKGAVDQVTERVNGHLEVHQQEAAAAKADAAAARAETDVVKQQLPGPAAPAGPAGNTSGDRP